MSAGSPMIDAPLETCRAGLAAAEAVLAAARRKTAAAAAPEGRADPALLEAEQTAVHGFAWFAAYVEALRSMLAWAERLRADGALGGLEALLLQTVFGEYLAQIEGGVPMSQGEIIRPADLGLDAADLRPLAGAEARRLITAGNSAAARMAVAAHIAGAAAGGGYGAHALGDESLEMAQGQFRRFTGEKIAPRAHGWHLADALIPEDVIAEMAELGAFGLTVPEEWGGLGMGKTAMCVVTEELSRGYIGAGSLGTRSEIAAELIRIGGTKAQKQKYLAKIAAGEILPAAVFTEPGAGSDLGRIRTRAVREGGVRRITGAKTWITHAARADLMTLLARTGADEDGRRGLSMFLAEKPRGTDENPFPAPGMSGGEIKVLGYRGMKEYEIAFENFEVPENALLGGAEGRGFKQLMETFESARIQTAARAVGVAQNALELAHRYAEERRQFGRPLYSFPRTAGKIAWAAAETMAARQLTLAAARRKDSGRRCDVEAGMAKLLAARTAWAAADNALQIHGGAGYALEYEISRVLCDARILSIFEGAAEIQAHVIARGLLGGRN